MKKVFMALILAGLTGFSAEAQTDGIKTCEIKQDQVCRKGHGCYQTKYAENFKVCKNDRGYFICCETPDQYNTSFPGTATPAISMITSNQYEGYYPQDENNLSGENETIIMKSKTAPNGQNTQMSHCYGGNNVAELNLNPYRGCPSPQYDGPERNRERNINVVTQ